MVFECYFLMSYCVKRLKQYFLMLKKYRLNIEQKVYYVIFRFDFGYNFFFF